jgi:chromosome segregation ATPase
VRGEEAARLVGRRSLRDRARAEDRGADHHHHAHGPPRKQPTGGAVEAAEAAVTRATERLAELRAEQRAYDQRAQQIDAEVRRLLLSAGVDGEDPDEHVQALRDERRELERKYADGRVKVIGSEQALAGAREAAKDTIRAHTGELMAERDAEAARLPERRAELDQLEAEWQDQLAAHRQAWEQLVNAHPGYTTMEQPRDELGDLLLGADLGPRFRPDGSTPRVDRSLIAAANVAAAGFVP